MSTTLTDEHIDAIDQLVSAHKGPTLCATAHPEEQLFNEEIRSATKFVTYANLPYFCYRRRSERSLWVRRSDNRCAPELYVLASLKFGILHNRPFWIDGSPLHNALINVALPGQSLRTTRKSKFGVLSGTPEYWKRYYEVPENRDRARKAARAYSARKREELRLAKQVSDPDDLAALSEDILLPDRRLGEDDDKFVEKLNDPKVREEIRLHAQMLREITGLDAKEALRQARDRALGIEHPSVDDQFLEN